MVPQRGDAARLRRDDELDLHLAGQADGFAPLGHNRGGRFAYTDPRAEIPRGPRQSDETPYPGGQIRHAFDFNGDTTFTDLTAGSGIPTNGAIAKGIGDFDQDGDVDFIAVANKSMPPVVYLNDGA